MPGLKTLVMMQLKDKIDFSYLKSKKQTIFKVVFSILKFALISAVIYFAFYFLSVLRLTALTDGIPTKFFAIVFVAMVVLSIIVCTFGLTKSMYLSNDNQVLLTMPTSRLTVFLSKMIVYTIYEFIRNLTYIIPLLFAFGLVNSMPIVYYLWLILANVIITLLTISIGSLLSIPLLLLTYIVKKVKLLEYLLIAAVIFVVLYGTIWLINLIPENIDILGNWGTIFWELQDIFNNFAITFAPLFYLTVAFVGNRSGIVNQFFNGTQLLSLLVIVGGTIVIFAITFLIVRPLFFSMASKSFEYTKRSNIKQLKNRAYPAFWGSIKKESLITYRTTEKFNSLVLITVILPIAILLLNKIFGAMDTRLTGTYMTMAFNVLFIILVALSSNGIVAKIYSEEGLSSYINKTMPTSYGKILTSKLIINMVLINLSILASTIIFASFAKLSVLVTIILFLSLAMIYTGHMFWSASLDIMNPQNEQYATTGTHTNNPNEIKSSLVAFILSALITFIFYFLITENISVVWYKILFIGVLYFAWNVFMFFSKIKVYYKEK